jgi:lysophospholipase L1-like esterase
MLLLRLVLVASSLFVGGLLAEGLARLLFPQLAPRTARITKFWQYDSRYGWSHNPGASGAFETFGIQTFVKINSKGFRGPAIDYTRAPNKRRVLVLGDSYVWGYGVNEDEVFTELLRKAMPEVEVVNMGVSGYSTDQELLLYRDEGYKYKADLVTIVLTENDPLGNLLTQHYIIYGKPAFQVQDEGLALLNQPVAKTALWKRVASEFATRSYVLTAANRYLYSKAIQNGATSAAPPNQENGNSGAAGEFPRTAEEKITLRLLVELKREIAARQGEAELLVVFTEDLTHSQEIAQYLATFGIPSLDLEKHIHEKDTSLHLRDDFHWNAEGHKKVAEVLTDRLRETLK